MKRAVFLAAAVCAALQLAGCSGQKKVPEVPQTETPEASRESMELTLWTFPVGDWGNSNAVSDLINDFHEEYPDCRVSVKFLDYATGDDEIAKAAEEGTLPDLVLEGPERLVANWGEKGWMADLSDLWESEGAGEIYESVRDACRHGNGEYYEFPLCMTAHCMGINYEMFEEADALQYIDEETRTWSTEDFVSAVEALREHGHETAGIVYCGGQGGDQGTRALVTNLYSGSFTDGEHTEYVVDSPENIRALELLRDMDGIQFDDSAVGTDEIERFVAGDLAMAFCWNVSMEILETVNNPDIDFNIFPMTFPTDDGSPMLQGGIWGFGIFDSGDGERTEMAKTFIRFMTEDTRQYAKAVLASSYWPVREMPELYANDALMSEYGIFAQYMGDYYQVTPGWADVRTAWWNMLQKVGAGEDIAGAVKEFNDTANRAAQAAEGGQEQET